MRVRDVPKTLLPGEPYCAPAPVVIVEATITLLRTLQASVRVVENKVERKSNSHENSVESQPACSSELNPINFGVIFSLTLSIAEIQIVYYCLR